MNDDFTMQAILEGGGLGPEASVSSDTYGSTGLFTVLPGSRFDDQEIGGIAFDITDLLISSDTAIEGIQINSNKLDPVNFSAVAVSVPVLPSAAMIVNDVNLPNGFDAAQKDHLESLGYEVTVVTGSEVSDGVFTAADAETYDVLVVSESIGSSQANNLIGANVPMMHQESYGWSRHFFTQGLGKTWLNDPAGEVNIVDGAHQIVTDAGLAAGQVAFFTDPSIAWTTDTVESLVAGAVNVAQIANADGVAHTIIFTIDAGTELADASLAANRVCGFSLPGQDMLDAAVMTDDAWALFDAAIAWLDQ
jgi:hypothetical protein